MTLFVLFAESVKIFFPKLNSFCEAGLALMLYPFFICILICCTKDDTIRIATNKKEIHYEKELAFHVMQGIEFVIQGNGTLVKAD